MIESSYLVEGHRLRLPPDLLHEVPPPAAAAAGAPAGFVEQAVRRRLRDDKDQAFDWLGYVPGWLNHIPFGGLDVVSGPFSGCWMIYFVLNGMPRIGHLGLSDLGAAAAKANWRAFAATQAATVAQFRAFKPARVVDDPAVGRAIASRAYGDIGFLGLMTQARQCFSIAIGMEGNQVCRVIKVLHTHPEAGLGNPAWPP